MRVLLLGATGTIGRATAHALAARGHDVTALLRPRADPVLGLPSGVTVRFGDVSEPGFVARAGLRGERFDAVVSCMASRTGAPADAWAVDHRANLAAMQAAQDAGAGRFVLLSALCVQKPKLAFQHAKLTFEAALAASGLAYAIVRPTAFFKSLSGQVERVRRGAPYLVFGDGTLTACKPIADPDLAAFLVDRVEEPEAANRILPIGGPGPPITPREQGEALFALLRRPARFRSVPVRMLDGIVGALALAGKVAPAFAEKAELARIGRYYATESMLVLDPATGRYAADQTPETGSQTLPEHYAALLSGAATTDLGAHAVFGDG